MADPVLRHAGFTHRYPRQSCYEARRCDKAEPFLPTEPNTCAGWRTNTAAVHTAGINAQSGSRYVGDGRRSRDTQAIKNICCWLYGRLVIGRRTGWDICVDCFLIAIVWYNKKCHETVSENRGEPRSEIPIPALRKYLKSWDLCTRRYLTRDE